MIDILLEHAPLAAHLLVFAAGASVGSFLNVVIARLPAGESLVRPASRCPKCGTPIAWHDNIPVLAWIWLRAKCRNCGLPISARYPMVELLLGLLALGILRAFGPSYAALGFFVFVAALVALAYIDLDTWLLPHEITWPLLGLGLLSPLWNPAHSFFDAVVGGAIGIAAFGGVALFGEKVLKREVMGWGDVWLLGGIGAWLGWRAVLPVILLSSIQGLFVGVIMLAVKKRSAAKEPGAPEPLLPPAVATQSPPTRETPVEAVSTQSAPIEPAATQSVPIDAASTQTAPIDAASTQNAPIAAAATQTVPIDASSTPDAPGGPALIPAAHDVPVIPGAAADPEPSEEDWVPPATAVPFGPFLALAAIEQVLLGAAIQALYNRITFGL